uniref:Endonuclease/exonuclease/phosphatase domain-containing protein n=1 Tax=Labrus bergylta TaxID=56723 RepID=A0A3Q3F9T3_9LABR
MRSLKIGSLNINGGRDRQKRGLISEISTQKNIDILFLQETHTTPSDETDWAAADLMAYCDNPFREKKFFCSIL